MATPTKPRPVSRVQESIAVKPAYQGASIVNLTASVIRAAGGEAPYPLLEGLDAAELGRARHLVLIVIDGLGYRFLRSVPEARVMHRGLRGSITSVYPPTTASAVTSFLTGLAPKQHGLTGWFVFLPRLGSVVSILPFTTRLGGLPLASAGVDARALLGHTPVFDLIPRPSYSVVPQDIAHSAFNAAHSGRAAIRPYRTLEQFFAAIESIVRAARAPTFTYAYWPELDRLAHANGIAHPRLRAHLAELDGQFGGFLDSIRGTDTAVLATADHGFVDVEPGGWVRLGDHPLLEEMLLLPLCGEPRTAYCYVAGGREADFVGYVESELSHAAVCIPSEELIERGYFGPGAAHPELRRRVGDYALIMRDGHAIVDALPGERSAAPVGVHGGGSTAELEVPLISAMV